MKILKKMRRDLDRKWRAIRNAKKEKKKLRLKREYRILARIYQRQKEFEERLGISEINEEAV